MQDMEKQARLVEIYRHHLFTVSHIHLQSLLGVRWLCSCPRAMLANKSGRKRKPYADMRESHQLARYGGGHSGSRSDAAAHVRPTHAGPENESLLNNEVKDPPAEDDGGDNKDNPADPAQPLPSFYDIPDIDINMSAENLAKSLDPHRPFPNFHWVYQVADSFTPENDARTDIVVAFDLAPRELCGI